MGIKINISGICGIFAQRFSEVLAVNLIVLPELKFNLDHL